MFSPIGGILTSVASGIFGFLIYSNLTVVINEDQLGFVIKDGRITTRLMGPAVYHLKWGEKMIKTSKVIDNVYHNEAGMDKNGAKVFVNVMCRYKLLLETMTLRTSQMFEGWTNLFNSYSAMHMRTILSRYEYDQLNDAGAREAIAVEFRNLINDDLRPEGVEMTDVMITDINRRLTDEELYAREHETKLERMKKEIEILGKEDYIRLKKLEIIGQVGVTANELNLHVADHCKLDDVAL